MTTNGDRRSAVEPPKNANRLQGAITRAAQSRRTTHRRVQSLVANTIVGQVLPEAAVKGGTGLKLRFGDRLTRETPDLDAAFRGDRDAFTRDLQDALAAGWGDFGGTVIEGEQRAPGELLDRLGAAYVMQPIRVKLTYKKATFCSVDLEVGYDELEATTNEPPEETMSREVLELFAELGLPEPAPVRVLPLHHQISQKLHACSEPGSARAHDLVDLQLMAPHADDALVHETSVRLFRFRKSHAWPPTVTAGPGWEPRYTDAADGLDVLPLPEAVHWVNDYIARVDAAGARS